MRCVLSIIKGFSFDFLYLFYQKLKRKKMTGESYFSGIRAVFYDLWFGRSSATCFSPCPTFFLALYSAHQLLTVNNLIGDAVKLKIGRLEEPVLARAGGMIGIQSSWPIKLLSTAGSLEWFGDEYGMVTCSGSAESPSIGTVLELVTSHCDPTINLFDCFHLTREREVVGTWPIDLRGCCQ
jgi:D-serine deaminase-like pyridoxal phosphate-dependent protein